MTGPDFLNMLINRHGAEINALTEKQAVAVADRLRVVAEALPGSTPSAAHVATMLSKAAELVERRAGIT